MFLALVCAQMTYAQSQHVRFHNAAYKVHALFIHTIRAYFTLGQKAFFVARYQENLRSLSFIHRGQSLDEDGRPFSATGPFASVCGS